MAHPEPLTCYLKTCDKPGVVAATGQVQDPMHGGMQLVEIAFCQQHAQTVFGDLSGLFTSDFKEIPDASS